MAGALAAPAVIALARVGVAEGGRRLAPLALRPMRFLETVLHPLRRAGAEGASPTDRERLRLQLLAAAAGVALGGFLGGLVGAAVVGLAAPWCAGRALEWHRERYRRRLDAGVAAAALALADALVAGQAVRGALATIGRGLEGPIGFELRRLGGELALGAETDTALEQLRRRARSRRVDLVVAAIRVQRRSGGALATLLRDVAATMDDQERLEDEARAASAQARFTSVLVLSLPVVGLLLAELASPGLLGRTAGSLVGAWLLGAAVVMQVLALLMIRRISRLTP
jgi:tight adherence protein B